MTMDLIGPHGAETYTHTGWQMLIDLALGYGWKPAGTLEPEPPSESDGDLVSLDAEDLAKYAHAGDDPLAQAIASACQPPADPVLAPYFLNSGYRVTDADALALATALERALPDLPDHEALEHKSYKDERLPEVRLFRPGTPVNPVEWFSGRNKAHLKRFIAFCKQGGFAIW